MKSEGVWRSRTPWYEYWIDKLFSLLPVISVALTAWAIQIYWNWFVVPLGVVQITYIHAFALYVLVQLCVWMQSPYSAGHLVQTKDVLKSRLFAVALPLFAIAGGFVCRFIMVMTY